MPSAAKINKIARQRRRDERLLNDSEGYTVYLMGNVEKNRYKIGISRRVTSRLEEVQASVKFPLQICFRAEMYETRTSAREVERILHTYYRNSCVGGEWFHSINVKDFLRTVTAIRTNRGHLLTLLRLS